MTHLYVIVTLVSLHLAGAWAGGLLPEQTGLWARVAIILAPFVVIGVAAALATAWCVRRIDRRADPRAILLAHRAMILARMMSLLWHLGAVFLLGLLDLVRRATGDLVLADELIAALPAFLLLVWTYRLAHPIERRVRQAVLIRELDEGRPVYAFPGPWRYVVSILRNNAAIMGLPLLLIIGWAELLVRVVDAFSLAPARPDEAAALLIPAVQLGGAIAIFALIPPLMVRVWDTVKIPPGPLREQLEKLSRDHNVRVRSFLIWRTHGAMLNAAVIGITPWLRYIVLTDALLDHLPEVEVEAVAAHEVAHVRKRHMLWLAIAVLGSALLLGELVVLASDWIGIAPGLSSWLGAAVSLAGVLLILGIVSRRFEWQADAFAAGHLSAALFGARSVTGEAADAMSNALARVARVNGMREDKFTWRHGSIATRRRRLAGLVGQPIHRLGIDRHVRAVVLIAALILVAGLALTAYGMLRPYPA